ncbi:cinnamoyl- reductase [Trichoderma arundinaceum]|uniref:Cinnamoyl-reductase n=1 Tax=Trichoderma arundinaceum TaxID=490622 RepID=A0A395NSF0_TRIAR|nr:cinnamoyl- reductase [Trichoderma arundinaceum]
MVDQTKIEALIDEALDRQAKDDQDALWDCLVKKLVGLTSINQGHYGAYLYKSVLDATPPESRQLLWRRYVDALTKMLIIVGMPKTLNALYSMIPIVDKGDIVYVKKSDWEVDKSERGWEYARVTHGEDWANSFKKASAYAPDIAHITMNVSMQNLLSDYAVHDELATMALISKGTILINGASSFVGAHVLEQFLSEGTPVRGVVRSQASANRILRVNTQYASLLSFAIVPDITSPGAFDDAVEGVEGVEGVIHIASPFTLNIKDNEKELLIPAIRGTTQVLESTYKYAPRVKRVVIPASFASIVDLSKGLRESYIYTEKDFNPATYDEAMSKDADASFAYGASKALAEKAAWTFVEENRPEVTISVINPLVIYGPNHHYIDNLNEMNTPSSRFSFQQIGDILQEKFPELRDRVPVGSPGQPITGIYDVDSTKAKKELGIDFRV